jgi:hypothetical protein
MTSASGKKRTDAASRVIRASPRTIYQASGGTEVGILCENVPSGIRPSDHQMGLTSTLKNLAAFTE